MNGRTLRSTAGLAGTFAAAAAGALTVGLISGVVHTAQAQSATTATSNSGASTGTTSKSGTSSSNRGSANSGLGGVSQNVQPVGGSHGS